MEIGVARIVLEYFGNQNVSRKRKEMTSLCEDLRRKFNVSATEVAAFDDPERCVLGFAVVIPENWKSVSAQALVEKICEEIDTTAFARVTVEDWDLLTHGGHEEDIEDERSPEAREIARRREAARRRKSED